jgi:hypothetical protein
MRARLKCLLYLIFFIAVGLASKPALAAWVYATSSGSDTADCGTLSPYKPC